MPSTLRKHYTICHVFVKYLFALYAIVSRSIDVVGWVCYIYEHIHNMIPRGEDADLDQWTLTCRLAQTRPQRGVERRGSRSVQSEI